MGNKKGQAPPRYDDTFKEGAIKLVTEQGPSREAAAELGICIDTLRSWIKSAGIQVGICASSGSAYAKGMPAPDPALLSARHKKPLLLALE